MKKIELYKNLVINDKALQVITRKNFAATVFFDFFWKGKKVITLPQNFYILPWGNSAASRRSLEEYDIYLSNKEYGIRHYSVQEHTFYLAIKYSFGSSHNCDKEELNNSLITNFFCGNYDILKKPYKKMPALKIENESFLTFASLLEKEILNFMTELGEDAISKILSLIESKYGICEKLPDMEEKPSEEVFSFVNNAQINFCSEIPKRKRIDVENYFSYDLIRQLIEDITFFGLLENPFKDGIDEPVDAYREYLLTLYGPGKWEWTNLEKETLHLSIEELACLHILFNPSMVTKRQEGKKNILNTNNFFIGKLKDQEQGYNIIPYLYFWYKLNETTIHEEELPT